MIGICIVMIFFVNIVWQIHMFMALADDEIKDVYKFNKEKVAVPKQKDILSGTTEQIYRVHKKEKVQTRNKFEVNNWRKMHGLIKKSRKTWKKGKRYGITPDRRR